MSVELVGVVLLVLSYIFEDTWFADAAINFGSALVLFSPLLLAGNWLERRLGRVESTQEEIRDSQDTASSRLSQLGERVQEIELSQEGLRDEVMGRIGAVRDADRQVFSKVSTTPNRRDVAAALAKARQLRLIAEKGLQIPIRSTELYLRFSGNDYADPPFLQVIVEDLAANHPKVVQWDDGESVADFLIRVTEEVQSRDMYPGDGSWRPVLVMPDLAEVLGSVFEKAHGGQSTSRYLGPVFQLFPPQWAITEDYLVCTDALRPYDIHLSRLHEIDWDSHMTGKTWVDSDSFREAFFAAEELTRRLLRPSRSGS